MQAWARGLPRLLPKEKSPERHRHGRSLGDTADRTAPGGALARGASLCGGLGRRGTLELEEGRPPGVVARRLQREFGTACAARLLLEQHGLGGDREATGAACATADALGVAGAPRRPPAEG